MHPAEKEMIMGALEQIEASVRTLRRYLAYAARTEAVSARVGVAQAEAVDNEQEDEDKLEQLVAQMMMGGHNDPSIV